MPNVLNKMLNIENVRGFVSLRPASIVTPTSSGRGEAIMSPANMNKI